ncbi:hypothetical protein [Moraxella lacunata]
MLVKLAFAFVVSHKSTFIVVISHILAKQTTVIKDNWHKKPRFFIVVFG